MIYLVMILMGIFTLILGFMINFKEKIDLIPGLDGEVLKKIKKKKVMALEFGFALFLISIASFGTAILYYFFGQNGMYIGVLAIVLSALNFSSLQRDIPSKISSRKY